MLFRVAIFVFAYLLTFAAKESRAQAGCGSQCPQPAGPTFDVTEFGATPNDPTDEDLAAFQQAVDAAASVGLDERACATVFIPPGVYHFQQVSEFNRGLILRDNVCLVGSGRTQTLLAGMVPMHVIWITRANTVSVEGLAIDNIGSAADFAHTHGIRLSNASNVLLRNLRIKNTYAYGIGFQGSGQFQDITVDNVDIKNTLADAIDFKNRTDRNTNILLRNITIANFGIVGNSQAGIDVRGGVTMKNISIAGVRSSQSGIRFRFTGDGRNGTGGINSQLIDSEISGVASGGIGIDITNLNNTISSTKVLGSGRQGIGIRVLSVDDPHADTNTLISAVTMLDLDTGVESGANGVTVDRSTFSLNNTHLDDRLGTVVVKDSAFERD